MMKHFDPKDLLARWVVTLQDLDFEGVQNLEWKLLWLGPTSNTNVVDYDDVIPVPGDGDDIGSINIVNEPTLKVALPKSPSRRRPSQRVDDQS